MVDHHLIADLLPALGQLLFRGRMPDARLSLLQAAIVLGLALQRKDVAVVAAELGLPVAQCLALYNKSVRKFSAGIKARRAAHVRDVELGLDEKSAAANERRAAALGATARPLGADEAEAAAAAAAKPRKRDRESSGGGLLAALEEGEARSFAIDDATAADLAAAAGTAPGAGSLLQVPARARAPADAPPAKEKDTKKSSKKKKKRRE